MPLLRRVPPLALVMLVLVSATRAQDAKQASAGEPVATQEGVLPIILSAPHGGLAAIPGVPPRKGEGIPKGPKGFFTGRDTGTEQLTYALAAAVEAKLGKKPYFVVAKFHRKFLDPNRPAALAYEDARARPMYDHYHQTLARYCRDVQKAYGRGLLLDVHGQGAAPDTIFRGTKNGQTVTLLVQRYGIKAQNGPQSFFGLLAAQGFKVHPLDDGKEQAGFTGGYIVQTYGSHQGYGIDAIQLEFGGTYRAKERIKDTAARVADVIAAYRKLYLPQAPR
jgi:N-formylglutamate amidohydrolase